ncbi:MAG: nucleotidyltransferase family protein [Winogradskyella sp.]|nr:nucleotidyltransferase family protein [Winogradskyella sp.]
MDNLVVTFRNIADILSFESSNSKLERQLTAPEFDWDVIVIEGSKHLVLPAIYCRLKAKKLLHVLPKELEIYLEELTAINRNRNTTLLKQIQFISKLLNEHQIDHVFLKGAALLSSGFYKDIAERMVGDIDILISKEQLTTAFELIKHSGYTKTYGFAYQTIGYRHLDRLIAPNELAAIELHDEVLIEKYRKIIDVNNILDSKIYCNTIAIPDTYHLGMHHILAWQINDLGHFYRAINLKTFYDSIILKVYANELLILDLSKNKFGRSYLALSKYYFEEFSGVLTHTKSLSYQKLHLKYTTNPVYKQGLKAIKQHYIEFLNRLILVFYNKNYRLHVLKKIFITQK